MLDILGGQLTQLLRPQLAALHQLRLVLTPRAALQSKLAVLQIEFPETRNRYRSMPMPVPSRELQSSKQNAGEDLHENSETTVCTL